MRGVLRKLVLGGGAVLLTAGALGAAAPAAFAAASAGPAAATPQAGAGQQHDRRDARRLIRRAVFVSEAQVLGLTRREFLGDLRGGQTVQQLAQAKGMDEAAFRSALVAALKPRLDALVDRGAITRGQADAVVDRIQKGQVPLWNGLKKK